MPGSLGPISTAISIWVATKDVDLQAKLMMFTVSILMWFAYGITLYKRNNYLSKIDYITSDGVAVFTNGFIAPKIAVEGIIKTTLSQWEFATGWPGVKDSIKGSVLEFKEYPIVKGELKYAGLTIGNDMMVGFKPNLKTTALSHELGHIIHAAWSGIADNEACHAFMEKYKLL
jgi:hypothetical protein